MREQIEAFITQFPIYQYAFLSPDELEFSDRVRVLCKQECSHYRDSWSCPPAVGKLPACKARCLSFTDGLFFSSVTNVRNPDDEKSILKCKRDHEKLTQIVENRIRKLGAEVFTLTGDCCFVCDKCGFPKEKCQHPDLMHPCIESHGILTANLIESCSMDAYLGEHLIMGFTLILYRPKTHETFRES